MAEPEKIEKPQQKDVSQKEETQKETAQKNVAEKSRFAQTHYLFPCLVYIQEKLKSGELTPEIVAEVVTQNTIAYGHDNYTFPEDWQEQMPHLVNRYGWRIFELPKVLKEQKEAAAQKRLLKKQERQEKQQQEKLAKAQEKLAKGPEKPPSPEKPPVQPAPAGAPKKKIIVVKKKT
ncbi:MAG: hypothetical protein LBG87_06620 [Spirochaetaceae bacterium]|jgi:hypothetical protein|nr:hypothetical protein [Spirochaetaceae bacterium]